MRYSSQKMCVLSLFSLIALSLSVCGQHDTGAAEVDEVANDYAFAFLDWESNLPKRYGFHIDMLGIRGEKGGDFKESTVTYDACFDNEAQSWRQDMRRRQLRVSNNQLLEKLLTQRIKIKDDLYERFNVQPISPREPRWSKVSEFHMTNVASTFTPQMLPIHSHDLRKEGRGTGILVTYLKAFSLKKTIRSAHGIRGVWAGKSGGQIAWTMEIFFDSELENLPTEFKKLAHDGRLIGDALLTDKGTLVAETKTKWKRIGTQGLCPVHADSILSANGDQEEYSSWQIDVQWHFGKDAKVDTIASPADFDDVITLRKKFALEPSK